MAGNTARAATKNSAEYAAVVCPEEMLAIRRANHVPLHRYRGFVAVCADEFPDRLATLSRFHKLLIDTLGDVLPDGNIAMEHHFERIHRYALLPESREEFKAAAAAAAGMPAPDGDDAKAPEAEDLWRPPASHDEEDATTPTTTTTTARPTTPSTEARLAEAAEVALFDVRTLISMYSYIVDSEPEDRLDLLLDVFNTSLTDGAPVQTPDGVDESQNVIGLADLEDLVDALVSTWQLPSKARVKEGPAWPVPTFALRTCQDHVEEGLAFTKAPPETNVLTYEEAKVLLRCKVVCVWNECVAKRPTRPVDPAPESETADVDEDVDDDLVEVEGMSASAPTTTPGQDK